MILPYVFIVKGADNMLKCGCAREAVERYGDMLYRICLLALKNTADAEDAVQETFIRYVRSLPISATSSMKKHGSSL